METSTERLAEEISDEFPRQDLTDEAMEEMSDELEKGEPVCLKSGTQIKSKDQKWQR